MKGYYKNEEQTKLAIDEDGYFHTGDIGEFDEDGLLKITGRMKEIFKDSMGKYISPALIEGKFTESPLISMMMVVGENQKFAAALIVPNFENLKTWCEENHVAFTSNADVITTGLFVNKGVISYSLCTRYLVRRITSGQELQFGYGGKIFASSLL